MEYTVKNTPANYTRSKENSEICIPCKYFAVGEEGSGKQSKKRGKKKSQQTVFICWPAFLKIKTILFAVLICDNYI